MEERETSCKNVFKSKSAPVALYREGLGKISTPPKSVLEVLLLFPLRPKRSTTDTRPNHTSCGSRLLIIVVLSLIVAQQNIVDAEPCRCIPNPFRLDAEKDPHPPAEDL